MYSIFEALSQSRPWRLSWDILHTFPSILNTVAAVSKNQRINFALGMNCTTSELDVPEALQAVWGSHCEQRPL